MATRGWLKFALRRVLPALAVLALLLASLKLAEDAAGGGGVGQYYRWILAAAAAALAMLALAIAQRLWRLRVDLQQRRAGRAAWPAPAASCSCCSQCRRSWSCTDSHCAFSMRRSTTGSTSSSSWRSTTRSRSAASSSTNACAWRRNRPSTSPRAWTRRRRTNCRRILDDEIDELGATQLTVFGDDGRVIATASSDPRYLNPPLPDAIVQMRVQGNGRYAAAEPIGDTLMLRVAVPVGSDVPASRRLLQGLFPLPTRLQTLTRGIENASFDFQRLKFLRGSLKLTFALILTFALLLSALLVTLAAFGVARRLVAPLGRLIAATRAVGAGRYDTPLPIASNDELGFLVNSFGQMTREIELASARAHNSAQETEQQRAWLVALLERLSAGVLGFDHDGRLRIANRAAEAILGVSTAQLSRPLAEPSSNATSAISPHSPSRWRGIFAAGLREWREELVVDTAGGRRVLMLRGTALPDDAGYVAVFDDLTVLNRAQRDAAWGEVARRLAHEVRNPLTPIQLAAERLRRRFLGRLSAGGGRADRSRDAHDREPGRSAEDDGQRVRRLRAPATGGAASDRIACAARRRARSLRERPAHRLDARPRRRRAAGARRRGAPAPGAAQSDQERARSDRRCSASRRYSCRTRLVREDEQDWVELAVADNGPGLPSGFGDRWFEPYTTSKNKGTGLGLAVVKKIAEEHGGSIRAENRAQGGAVFTLRLPIDVAPSATRQAVVAPH